MDTYLSTGHLDIMKVLMHDLQNGGQVHGFVTQNESPRQATVLHRDDMSVGHVAHIRETETKVENH